MNQPESFVLIYVVRGSGHLEAGIASHSVPGFKTMEACKDAGNTLIKECHSRGISLSFVVAPQ